ncbi:MAG TPA: DUF3562 domain-containing protein [Candidatus Methylomirabilis sp.]|nr:DUF3562 domain-containing protein [Candidatus Methylomirabilis sp.]
MALYDNDKERALHSGAIHDLSRESGLPEWEIGRMYEQQLDKLKQTARVKDYLPVLTRRLVKETLRHRH